MNLETSLPRSVSINCGTLDMRETTEQTASRIDHVNSGNVLVTAETRPLMTMFTINMGSVIEVPVEVRLKTVHSREVMGRESFSGEGARLFILNSGSIILEPDVTAEGVERSWFGILNSGSILYPEHVAGAIMDKLTEKPGGVTPPTGLPPVWWSGGPSTWMKPTWLRWPTGRTWSSREISRSCRPYRTN